MAKLHKDQDLITSYLYHDMSEEEKRSFEERLEHDKELADEVRFQQHILNSIKAHIVYEDIINDPNYKEIDANANELIRKHDNVSEEEQINRKILPRIYYVYLVAAVLTVMITFRILLLNTTSMDEIFAQYYDVNKFMHSEQGVKMADLMGDENYNVYRNGLYMLVIENLRKGIEAGEKNARTSLALGLAYMANGDYTLAQEIFSTHLEEFDTYREESEWYLGLTLIKLDQTDKAISLFKKLAASNSIFSNKAARIERKLQRNAR